MKNRTNDPVRPYCYPVFVLFFIYAAFIPCHSAQGEESQPQLNAGRNSSAQPPYYDISVADPAYQKGKGPVVLFDQGHHNLHSITGIQSYRAFADIIENDGYVVKVNESKFIDENLKGRDILVIVNALEERNIDRKTWEKPPYYPAFTPEEVKTVHAWVKKGGKLLLIADHQPFGKAAYEMAEIFGIPLSTGRAIDPNDNDLYTRENGKLLDHPVTRGRKESEKVNKILTVAGESFPAPEGSGFLKFSASAYDIEPGTNEQRPIPGHFQGAAFAYGKGRVVVLGEAAMLSVNYMAVKTNSGVFFPSTPPERVGGPMNPKQADNRKLLLNIMHYLSGLLEPGVGVR